MDRARGFPSGESNSSAMSKPFHPCRYLDEPDSVFSEMIRSLRSNIKALLYPDRKSFLVTSSWEGEGKSTVCINLAAALVDAGQSTLLVDGDMRQASLTRLLLSEPTGAPAPTDWIPGLRVLGFKPCSPAEASNRLADPSFLAGIKRHFQEFEVVVVDSPPMSVCKDALVLGTLLDGAVMVVSERKFRGAPEGHFSEDLRDQGINFWGSVITDSLI